jgi:hypothetical protein
MMLQQIDPSHIFNKALALAVGGIMAGVKSLVEFVDMSIYLAETGLDKKLIELINEYLGLIANVFMIVSFGAYLLLNLKDFKYKFFSKAKSHEVRQERQEKRWWK